MNKIVEKRLLDYSLFTDDSTIPEYSEELRSRLKQMPETFERTNSSILFAQQAQQQSEPWISAAFLRAALAELFSMQELQKIDRPQSSIMKFKDVKNPLLHLLILLRHLNIHVRNMAVESEHSAISLDGNPLSIEGGALSCSVLVVTNISSMDLVKLDNGKYYNLLDLDQCVAWFNERQRSCGADKLIVQGVAMFATLLCDRHSL